MAHMYRNRRYTHATTLAALLHQYELQAAALSSCLCFPGAFRALLAELPPAAPTTTHCTGRVWHHTV